MRWLAHALGLDNASGPWYLWWSGVFGDVGIFGAAFVYFRSRNCHVKRCPRIGRHPVDGTPYVTCRKHHPHVDGAPSAAEVARAAR